MKLGLGLYRQLLNRETLRFVRQVGVTHIVAHLPGHVVRGGSKIITSRMSRRCRRSAARRASSIIPTCTSACTSWRRAR